MCLKPPRDNEAAERQQIDKPNRISVLDLLNDRDDGSEVPTLPQPVQHELPEKAFGQIPGIGDTDFSQDSPGESPRSLNPQDTLNEAT